MKRRILAGMGANSFGMAVTVAIQILSLPVFLHYWDTRTYGVWLMLSAIPAYLSMADVGMVTASANRMTMALGRGDAAEANRVFQSAQVFMSVICGGLCVVLTPAVMWVPWPGLEQTDQRLALLALSLGILLSLMGGLYEAAFRATHRYAHGTLLASVFRLLEGLGSMLGLMLWGSFTAVALCGLVVKLAGVLLGCQLAVHDRHGLRWGYAQASLDEVRTMIRPAFSFMVFPLANALSFQGVTLMVGALFGPAIVALFNTYRTLARVSVQVTAVFSHALWPEFSRMFGQGGGTAVASLFRRSAWLGALQACALSTALFFAAPWLLRLWTHGQIAFEPGLMLLMLLYAAVGGLWHVPRVLLMATNRHSGMAGWSLLAGLLAIALAWALGHAMAIEGVGIAMLSSEVFIALITLSISLRTLAAKTDFMGARA
jgi:O-antigen/teichoic acid export membrane protein